MGTEGRRGGVEEYGPSEGMFDSIVFRGSDVKDLRIEDPPKEKAAPPPMPDDPAIMNVSSSESHLPDHPSMTKHFRM